MTATGAVAKLTAKTRLKNKWLMPIIVSLIPVFSFFIINLSVSYLSLVTGDILAYVFLILGLIFLLCPLILGALRYFWRFIFDVEDTSVSIFFYFSEKKLYLKALHLTFTLSVKGLFIALILFFPSIISDLFSGVKIYELLNVPIPIWSSNLYYLSVFLKTVAAVLLVFIMSRYYLAPFLIIADENMEVAEAVHMSCTISKETLLDYIYLIFGFFGWGLLSVLVFPLTFTLPYFLTSLSYHIRFAIADFNKRVKSDDDEMLPTYAVEM